jgi:hypothetical protein
MKEKKESPKCPKCGFVMCEQFDDRQVGNVTLATPNGKYICYKCEGGQ